jgi:hypothetical protein
MTQPGQSGQRPELPTGSVAAPQLRDRTGILALQRLRSRTTIHLAIALVVLATTWLVTSTTAALAVAAVNGVSELVTRAPAEDASLLLETHRSTDSATQDAAAQDFFSERFAGLGLTTVRSVRGVAPTPAGDIVITADEGIAAVAELESGEWPSSATADAIPVALQERAAESLGLEVGDTYLAGAADSPVTLVIVGTWLPTNIDDPRWHGDPAIASGFSGDRPGPFVMDEASVIAIAPTVFVDWTVVPDGNLIDPDRLAALAAATDPVDVAASVERYGDIADQSTSADGGLSATFLRAESVARAASAVSVIPLALTGAIALITLLQLAGLLAAARETETYMLRARGASVAGLTRLAFGEAFASVIPALVLGLIVAAGRLLELIMSVVVALGAVAVLTVRAFFAARSVVGAGARQRSSVASVLLTLALVVAAALSTWQLLLYGASGVNILGSLAPVLCLVAFALVLGALLSPVAGVISRAVARSSSLGPALAARQVARGAQVFGVAILVVALGAGGIVLAGAVTGTISRVDADAQALATGGDVRVRQHVQGQVGDNTDPVTAAPYAVIESADAATVVLVTTATIGGDTVTLVAADAGTLGSVTRGSGTGTGNEVTELAPLDVPSTSLELPAGTSELSLSITGGQNIANRAGDMLVSGWLVDSDGALAKVVLGNPTVASTATGPVTVTAQVPSGVEPWHVVALDAVLRGSPGQSTVTVTFDSLTANGSAVGAGPQEVSMTSQRATGRALFGVEAEALPIVVTDAFAERTGHGVGSTLSLGLSTGRTLDAIVVGTIGAIPGSNGSLGAFADLAALNSAMLAGGGPVLQAADVWIATAQPDAVRAAAQAIPHVPSSVTTRLTASSDPVLQPTSAVLWTNIAGVATVALIAFAATASTILRARRRETDVLSALGLRARASIGLRVGELAGVSLFAILAGAISGLLAAVLSVGVLAEAAVPAAPASAGLPALASAGLPLVLFVGGVALVIVGYGFAVRASLPAAKQRPERRGK